MEDVSTGFLVEFMLNITENFEFSILYNMLQEPEGILK
jgi:hypothetical protein